MTPALQFALWLIFASITIGGLGLAALLILVTVRAIVRGWRQVTRPITPSPIPVPSFGSATIRSSIGIVATFWLTLLVLIPLLALALWQFAVELGRGRVGASLVLAIVHLVLIWALLRLGTRVESSQRRAIALASRIGPPVTSAVVFCGVDSRRPASIYIATTVASHSPVASERGIQRPRPSPRHARLTSSLPVLSVLSIP